LKEKENIDTNELITLYDTHGMPPEIVKNIAEKEGTSVGIPENFYSMIAELHSHEKKEETKQDAEQDLPETRALYYEDHYIKEFDAEVIWKNNTSNGTEIILDKTAFYPEGGGQPADKGTLIINGKEILVKHVEKHGKAIIHLIDEKLNIGDKVHGQLDWEHRYILMRHHTGTHVINGALRMLLGEHIWQAGSQLGVNDARFDFAHYKNITEKERKEIEDLANKLVQKGQKVEKKVMDRNSAERIYGFRLYQGGVPPGNSIRVLNIPVEACGGMHLNNINEIEKIRILKTERIQDGVNRLIFAAGKMVDIYHEEENKMHNQIVKTLSNVYDIKTQKNVSEQLKGVSKIFSVPVEQVDKTIKRFIKETERQEKTTVDSLIDACNHLFNEWKKTQKDKKKVSSGEIEKLMDQAETITGTTIKVIIAKTTDEGTSIGGAIIEEGSYVVHIFDGKKLVSMASENVDIDLRKIAPAIGKILGGSGGGKTKLTQSGGPNQDKAKEALEKAKELTITALTNR
jgi:alanyl-tRNA synthetase